MRIQGLVAIVVVSLCSVVSGQVVTQVGNDFFVNGEPFNGYLTDHADAYAAYFQQKAWSEANTTLVVYQGMVIKQLTKPTKLTTLRFADARQAPESRSYLIVQDDVASWPALVRIIPEDLNKPEIQLILKPVKGRRATLDFASLPQLEGTNFAVVVTIAEDQNSVTLTSYNGSRVERQRPDVNVIVLEK